MTRRPAKVWLSRKVSRLGIGHRLALSYGAIIISLIGLSDAAVLKLKSLSEATREALQVEYPKTVLINQVNHQLDIEARAMRNALIFNAESSRAQYEAEIASATLRMSAALSQLDAQVHDAVGRDLLRRIRVVHSAYTVNQDDFIVLLNQRRLGEARNLLIVDLHGYQMDYFALLEQFNRHQETQMLAAGQQANQAYVDARELIFGMAALALVLSALVTALFRRSLLRSLGGEPEYAVSIARRIAAGDIQTAIELGDRDSSSLLHVMEFMRQRLTERDEALRRANADLQGSVNTLSQMQAELVSSEKLAALGSLVAGVAHELNTPVGNSLLAASTMADATHQLERRLAQAMTRATLNAYIDEMHAASDILLRNLSRVGDLISSFKQVAVDRESSQRRQFKLHEVVNEICLTLQPSLRKTPYLLQAELPQDIEMSSFPGPLGQVLTNLINNSVLHAFEGREQGRIQISARKLGADLVEISVSDNGCGIPVANQKRVFEPFFTTKLGRGGSGLGLHIVFNIVTGVLGGKIRLVSQVDQGTTVTLTVPREAPDDPIGVLPVAGAV
ncbi:ATP-binding protein [Roseateles koreensis]|uniref:histidine kinase n=1 Tax=Roseateles koreensis TaxID=2987526 RepID=A0ABT5KW34_9BURK|nr:ATP-binding protein [Roseateles koreensis]MDC8786593.1 ATP-binding protein [Roseateles koreensis]